MCRFEWSGWRECALPDTSLAHVWGGRRSYCFLVPLTPWILGIISPLIIHTNMALAFWRNTLGRVRVLSYTALTVCVLLQTILLGVNMKTVTAHERPGLQVASSASVLISCSLHILVSILYPLPLLSMCLFEIPVFMALLSAVLSLAAPATSAFALSLTSSVLTSMLTVLTWVL